jgi:hypothetical protein
MISDLQMLRSLLSQLDPEADDFDLLADKLVMNLNPALGCDVCQAFFEFFEANPLSYAGAPGVFVHHIETFYPSYVVSLVDSVNRRPSLNGILMMNRVLNSSDCDSEVREQFHRVLRSVATNQSWEPKLIELSSRYLQRHGLKESAGES